jgi:lipoprotein-anchoring transpeptidase ErfK/SrfK
LGNLTFWRTGGAEVRTRVVARGAARVRARRLHAGYARTVVGCRVDPKGPAIAGPSTFAQASIPEPYRRHIVDYPRKEAPGTILVDSDARYLYYVQPGGKAIRYGVAVGEEAMAWSGVATVGRMAEWPDWIPTPEIQARLGPYPARVPGGPANPLGARALYLYEGNKDTLYRIHGTNQPEYIGQAISSGCIRMTNEDVIDLFDRVRQGATVVVLAPRQSAWMRPNASPRA